MIRKELPPPPLPIEKKLLRFIVNLIKYPFRIAKKYEGYNVGIGQLIAVKNEPNINGEDDAYFRDFQKKNTKLVFSFIYLPLLLGFLSFSYKVFQSRKEYITYYQEVAKPVVEERFSRKTFAYLNKIKYAVMDNPISLDDINLLMIFYFISICGAKFLSINPVFKIEEKIKKDLMVLGCVDVNGDPWKIVWLPEAMLVISFGKDPNALAQKSEFWATINFPPNPPKQSKKDLNKFVVLKKQELSNNMKFELKGDGNDKQSRK